MELAQGRTLTDVDVVRVDDKGKKIKDTTTGKSIRKTFSGSQWALMGSNPLTNGGWKVAAIKTPDEISKTGNLTGATLGDASGSGVDGRGVQGEGGDESGEPGKVDGLGTRNDAPKQDSEDQQLPDGTLGTVGGTDETDASIMPNGNTIVTPRTGRRNAPAN